MYSFVYKQSPAGYWRWKISTTSSTPLTGSVDVVEIIPESTNMNIGGGGPTNLKPVEVEVHTSGIDGTVPHNK